MKRNVSFKCLILLSNFILSKAFKSDFKKANNVTVTLCRHPSRLRVSHIIWMNLYVNISDILQPFNFEDKKGFLLP